MFIQTHKSSMQGINLHPYPPRRFRVPYGLPNRTETRAATDGRIGIWSPALFPVSPAIWYVFELPRRSVSLQAFPPISGLLPRRRSPCLPFSGRGRVPAFSAPPAFVESEKTQSRGQIARRLDIRSPTVSLIPRRLSLHLSISFREAAPEVRRSNAALPPAT